MLPFTDSFNYLIDHNRKYNKFQDHIPPRSLGHDHHIVSVPVSPSRNTTSGINALVRSRLAWLILVLIVIAITLAYQAYTETKKQERLLTYMDRLDELKVSMEHVKHHIVAATTRIRGYRRFMSSNNSSSYTATT